MKRMLSVCLLSCILFCGCAATPASGDAAPAGTLSSAAQTTAAVAQPEEEERFVSDLSAEITLQIADAPDALSEADAWDDILASFHESWPQVTVHLSDAEMSALQPGLVIASPAQLLPLEGDAPALHDLTQLYTTETFSALLPNAVSACMADDGHYFAYPFCVSVSCMAVNRRLLEEAGAMQYINEETRSWSTADFLLAVQALRDAGHETVLSLPCAEEADGTATRAFVLNLFGGSFATPARTGYEVRSENNFHTFETLAEHEGIVFAPEETEASARAAFLDGEVPMLCGWDYLMQMAVADEPDTDFLLMNYPTNGGAVLLPGSLYCLAVTDAGDAAQKEAATALLTYLTALPFPAKEQLLADGCFPAIRNLRGLYDTPVPQTAVTLALHVVPHFGSDERLLPDLNAANAAWNRMLAEFATGVPADQALKNFDVH